MPLRSADQPDVNPARLATDPLLAEIAEMVAYVNLHIGAHTIKPCTTRQKELWADLVDSHAVVESHQDPSLLSEHPASAEGPTPAREPRWWRPGHPLTAGSGNLPTSHSDPRLVIADQTPEPDPFRYTDEDPTSPRARGEVRSAEQWGDRGATRVARAALLDVLSDPTSPHRPFLTEDFVAVYEWAKAQVAPMRMSTGDRAGQIGSLRSYPSLEQARRFLAERRDARP